MQGSVKVTALFSPVCELHRGESEPESDISEDKGKLKISHCMLIALNVFCLTSRPASSLYIKILFLKIFRLEVRLWSELLCLSVSQGSAHPEDELERLTKKMLFDMDNPPSEEYFGKIV